MKDQSRAGEVTAQALSVKCAECEAVKRDIISLQRMITSLCEELEDCRGEHSPLTPSNKPQGESI